MSTWDDKAVDWYAERYGEDPTTRAVVEAAPIAVGDAVLDIGCGTGASLRHAIVRGAGQAMGVDLPRMIAHAVTASAGHAIEYRAGTAEDLPCFDAVFDGVLAVNSVHHWQDRSRGFDEALRVLRPGGWIVLGGERFCETALPEGQDYREDLATRGCENIEVSTFDGGFAISARKPAAEAGD